MSSKSRRFPPTRHDDGLVIERIVPRPRSSYVWDEPESEEAPGVAPKDAPRDAPRPADRRSVPDAQPEVRPVRRRPAPAAAETIQVPAWKRPFALPPNVRFTRTPDSVLRPKPSAEVPAQAERIAVPEAIEAQSPQPETSPQELGLFAHLPDVVFWDALEALGALPPPGAAPPSPAIVPDEPARAPSPRPRRGKSLAIDALSALPKSRRRRAEPVVVEPEPEPETEEEVETDSDTEEDAEVGEACEEAVDEDTEDEVEDTDEEDAVDDETEEEETEEEETGDEEAEEDEETEEEEAEEDEEEEEEEEIAAPPPPSRRVAKAAAPLVPAARSRRRKAGSAGGFPGYELPPLSLLAEPRKQGGTAISPEALEANARLLEGVLEDFGVRGEIIHVRPGPVVTLYELEPAPGIKSSRVIGLADDIARSMSALSARVAVVPGRNVIGIELPNQKRETVYFRELIGSEDFETSKFKLALCLGKTIGGEPVIAELAKMPHLLVAGTTGSGKSVAINTMILSLLYRLKPEECRLIMVDPKMLELSVYDGIPHLLSPVVTDPKKAVLALKWAVREMEERYKLMSKLGVRNIDGYNQRAAEARASGESVRRTVQTGFDRETGEALYEEEVMDLAPMPYIVVIVDEMADLMMVAGKDIEGAIQRLAQMARAAGIHLIMATQRPSVDVITGTIKANFPTRISFQVTSKIDSRTILGEQGAEQLLGQGDMLHMAGGGRISRVHGPFVSDDEVEKVVAHLKAQGRPDYLDAVTAGEDGEEGDGEDGEDGAVFDKSASSGSFGDEGSDLYDQAVKVVLRDKKCSTSYIQRRLQIGYNRAASLVERMEKEGLVGPANHAGKRDIIASSRDRVIHVDDEEDYEEA